MRWFSPAVFKVLAGLVLLFQGLRWFSVAVFGFAEKIKLGFGKKGRKGRKGKGRKGKGREGKGRKGK